MLGKKLINSGPISSGANTFASENFNTVLYTGNGAAQRIGGYINRGAVFNGSNSFISLPQNTDFDLNGNGSFSIWVKRNNTNRVWIIDKANGGSGGYSWQLYFHNGQYGFQMHDTSNNIITVSSGTSGIATNAWEHIVITSNTSRVYKMYVNGTLKNTQTLSAAVSVNTNGVTLGKYSLASGYEVNGTMDQLRFFNKELSQSEITTLYGETFASTTKSTTDIFNDNSGVALYQFEGNANATGSVPEIAFDSTINTSSIAYTVNNRKIAGNTSGSYASTRVTESKSSGKWYFEMYYNDSSYFPSSRSGLGLVCPTCTMGSYLGGTAQDDWAIFNGGNVRNNNSTVHNESLGDFSAGNVIMCALDLDNQKVYFGKNGTWFNSANPSNGTNGFTLSGSEYYAAGWVYNTSDQLTFRFREGDFGYTVPTGFSAYSETNYDGTASNVTYQEATNFSPDLVWIKSRSTAKGHIISDSVTNDGTSNSLPFLSSHNTDRQYTGSEAGGNYIRNLNSNGFSVGSSLFTGSNGTNFVAWCFNAGSGNAANNTDGSVASTVKANTAAGFSIVKFNGASGASTCGHGLSQAPELFIMKSLNVSGTWGVYVKNLGANKYLTLNDSVAQATSTTAWNNTHPTSTLLHWQGGIVAGGAGYTNVAYCFHSVAGYQKIGSYTGTGTAGNIVETGFEPAFLMIKIATANDSWFMVDNKRETTNPRGDRLFANSSAAEASEPGAQVNFLANGFEITGSGGGMGQTNSSGATYVYIAIAADPDQTDPTVENSFSPILWSGTGSARSVTGLGFKPDLIWWKARNASNYNWKAIDSINGPTKNLYNNLTNSLATDVATTSFDNDGFTFGSGGNGNVSGLNYVGYAWKAGDHDDSIPQINTEGTIDSIVSVNDAAGFSIVKYTGDGNASSTVGHGLSVRPELTIFKQLSSGGTSGGYWNTYYTANNTVGFLNATNAFSSNTSGTNGSVDIANMNSTKFGFLNGSSSANNQNGSGLDYIVYCWYSVSGYSKIGSYTGTGATGNTQSLGFRPRFIMIKSTSNAEPWFVLDSKRNPTNPVNNRLMTDSSAAEDGGGVHTVDFTNTGFTANGTVGNGTNGNGVSYIYMAFK